MKIKLKIEIETEIEFNENELTQNDLKNSITAQFETEIENLINSKSNPKVNLIDFSVFIP